MTEKDSNSSVRDEQFDQVENTEGQGSKKDEQVSEELTQTNEEQEAPVEAPLAETPTEAEEESGSEQQAEASSETQEEPVAAKEEKEEKIEEQEAATENMPAAVAEDAPVSIPETSEEAPEKEVAAEASVEEPAADTEVSAESEEATEETPAEEKEVDSDKKSFADREPVDYNVLNNNQLVDELKILLQEYEVQDIREDVEMIKSQFYKNRKMEVDEIKKKFIDEGGQEEDFKVEESPLELLLKDLLNIYRQQKGEFNKQQDELKQKNLEEKLQIIESIKELINSQESLNKTFHEFRDLQDRWKEIGAIPQSEVKQTWEKYHYQVEAFYDYIKINKELRDLDLKKNFEMKIGLCEKAEELLLEPSVVEAFRRLQELHAQWREIGPVSADKRTEIWERFKDATAKINHKHQEYFVNLKQEQKKNLEEKAVLCEKAEELAAIDIESSKDWEKHSHEIIELQKVWKTIGFAPKKHNTKIYERFRAACDQFFDKKREFFAQNREEQDKNLELKTELVMQAEAVQNSEDWKKTTQELIKLQKRWKEIGPVPPKHSDKIWKRFRAACDTFFNNKSKFFENIDSKYEDNLKAKEALLAEVEAFELGEDVKENLTKLKDFQRKWSEIGFVPIKKKTEIQEKYRAIINAKFDKLKLDEDDKSLLKFKGRIEGIGHKPNHDRRLNMERDKIYNKMKQLESDITLWENNIGFFSNSKNAESLIQDVERKIEAAKKKIQTLKEKLDIIDDYED